MSKAIQVRSVVVSSLLLRALVMGVIGFIARPIPAFAQAQTVSATATTSNQLEEVIVTAQRRAENIQNVPIAITAVSAKQLQAAGVVDSMALPQLVSGLTAEYQASSFQPHIRGIGTSAIGPGIENPVALYVDDVYYGSQVTALTDMTDVSQVTVLKGPQGTLFGRNATAGVIQITTRDPSANFEGDAQTELDNYLTTRNDAYVTGGLTDSLKANLSVSYTTQGHGWGTNIDTGEQNHQINRDVFVLSKWFFTPSDKTIIKVLFDYTNRLNSMGPNLVPPSGTTPGLPASPFFPGFVQPFVRTSNPWDSDSPLNTLMRLASGGTSVHIEHDFGFANLVSISAYRENMLDSVFEPSMGPTPEIYQFYGQAQDQFTQELRLVSPDNPYFNWQTGLYYYYSDDSLPYFLQDGYNAYAQHSGWTSEVLTDEAVLPTDSEAAFGQATVRVAPGTRLTAGLRYTEEQRSIHGGFGGTFYGSLVPQPFGPFGPTLPLGSDVPVAAALAPLSARKTFSKLTERAALDHDFAKEVLGYVSFSTGFKSGGFNADNPSALNPAYKPETVDTYEVGVKSELFNDTLRVNAAAFYNKYSNIQLISFIGVPTIYNAGDALTKGLDIDLEAKLADGFRLTGGFEYLDAKFLANAMGTLVTLGEPAGTIAQLGSVQGHTLPYAPEFSANLGLDYTKVYAFGTMDLNVTGSYSSGFYGEEDNLIGVPAYVLLNTALMWTANSNAWSVSLWGRNLTDKAIPSQLANATFGYSADYANPPRTYGFTVIYRFGK